MPLIQISVLHKMNCVSAHNTQSGLAASDTLPISNLVHFNSSLNVCFAKRD